MPAQVDQSIVIEFLSQPGSYGSGRDPAQITDVQVITTHASVIFLAGAYAYKLKRAVTYSYLDYSTVAQRQQACAEELRLNRRTAPTLYLDIWPIHRGPDGRLSLKGSGDVVDWVVVMRRFPQENLFSALVDHHLLTNPLLNHLTDRIVTFHDTAEVDRGFGGAAGVTAVIDINDENLRRTLTDPESARKIDALLDATMAAWRQYRPLLDQRRDDGRVRQCHGDLHLGNICLVDGTPTLFDCIEFSRLISCIDVLYDLAFLLMDLRHRGLTRQAGQVFNRYLDLTRDDDGLPLMPLFMSLRAAVRAHVTAAAAGPAQDGSKLAEAKVYLDLALELLQPKPVRLIAIGGLSGSGKSSVAAALAGEFGSGAGARVLRSDVVRKQLFNVAPEQPLTSEAYRPEVSSEVYRELLRRAGDVLRGGQSVIIDSVAARPAERDSMSALAAELGVGFSGIWLDVAGETMLQRVAERGKDASDANAAVVEQQLGYDLGPMAWHRLDANGARGAVVDAVRDYLKDGEPGHAMTGSRTSAE